MTDPRHSRDLLMEDPSFRICPDAFVSLARSDPAKSTRLRVETLTGLLFVQRCTRLAPRARVRGVIGVSSPLSPLTRDVPTAKVDIDFKVSPNAGGVPPSRAALPTPPPSPPPPPLSPPFVSSFFFDPFIEVIPWGHISAATLALRWNMAAAPGPPEPPEPLLFFDLGDRS